MKKRNKKNVLLNTQKKFCVNIYPLEKTALALLLDKEYLISKLNISKLRELDKKYLNYQISENNNEINIFFDKENFNLVGWQIEDIYQNLSITFISSIKINQKIDDRIFILPKNN